MAEPASIKLLLAALGGEGGGVFTAWLHRAALLSGHAIQSTFIPGVAQRTGATTYYLEIVPGAAASEAAGSGRQRLLLGLNAAPGEVDVVVASELLEAARAIEAGFVTPDRTLLIASTARVFTIEEKSALRDGRLDEERLLALARRFARGAILADFAAQAAAARAPLNAVLLGALAAVGKLPIPADAFRAAVREEGKAVEPNLRGFEAGLASAGTSVEASPGPSAEVPETARLARFPAAARAVLAVAIERLTDYQDASYAERYLARVGRFLGRPHADGAFVRELARHLAVRMSVEDVIRVAQLKVRAARLAALVRQAGVAGGDIVDVTEFLRPGAEEIFGLLPPRLGRALIAAVGRDRAWAMQVRTTRLPGFLQLKLLGALRRWRPHTLRFAEEDAWVEQWLDLVDRTLAVDAAAAREVVATAELVRGYGDTYRRGLEHWHRIHARLIEPSLAGRLPRATFADAVLQARLAASLDPAGEALARTLAAVGASGGAMVDEAQPRAS